MVLVRNNECFKYLSNLMKIFLSKNAKNKIRKVHATFTLPTGWIFLVEIQNKEAIKKGL